MVDFTLTAIFLLLLAAACVNGHESNNRNDIEFPPNVTGMLSGPWVSNKTGFLSFSSSGGDVVLYLESASSNTTDFLLLQGNYFLRDGFRYTTSRDIIGPLFGIYIPTTGRTVLVETSRKPPLNAMWLLYRNVSGSWPLDDTPGLFSKVEALEPVATRLDQCRFRWLLQAVMQNGSQGIHELKVVEGVGYTLECAAIFWAEIKPSNSDELVASALMYAGGCVILSALQLMAIARQINRSQTQAAASKVSAECIGAQCILDAYLFLFNLSIGVVVGDILFNAFATAAFFGFVLFSIFEMRYLFFVWRSKRRDQGETFDERRRQLSRFYSTIYCLILMGPMTLMWGGPIVFVLILVVLFSFWLFQIVHYARAGVNRAFEPAYIVISSISRLLPVLYLFCYPDNFLRIRPTPAILWVLGGWTCLQFAIMILQEILGPRWFIPAFMLPPKYNYYRAIPQSIPSERDEEAGTVGVSCVICMGIIGSSRRNVMVTPCNHVFHKDCLVQWMDIKMECPTCRSVLPTA